MSHCTGPGCHICGEADLPINSINLDVELARAPRDRFDESYFGKRTDFVAKVAPVTPEVCKLREPQPTMVAEVNKILSAPWEENELTEGRAINVDMLGLDVHAIVRVFKAAGWDVTTPSAKGFVRFSRPKEFYSR